MRIVSLVKPGVIQGRVLYHKLSLACFVKWADFVVLNLATLLCKGTGKGGENNKHKVEFDWRTQWKSVSNNVIS
mgnify:CR=1 FL=1